MKKSSYIIIAIVIALIAVTVVIMSRHTSKGAEETGESVVAETSMEEPTPEKHKDLALPEKDNTNTIYIEDLPTDLDVTERNEYLQNAIDYEGIYIDVSEEGFTVSDSFVWTDDTYWFDEDPNGFARYTYLYMPQYSQDGNFGDKASEALNTWAGENLDVRYCMCAALDVTEEDNFVEWYVIFQDYPEYLVHVEYDSVTDTYTHERIF